MEFTHHTLITSRDGGVSITHAMWAHVVGVFEKYASQNEALDRYKALTHESLRYIFHTPVLNMYAAIFTTSGRTSFCGIKYSIT